MSPSFLGRYSRLASPFTKQNCIRRVRLLGFSFSTSTAAAEHDTPGRTGPPPIRVGITESAGRGVFATRRIGAGDLIHTAKPVLLKNAENALRCIDVISFYLLHNVHNVLEGFFDVEMNTNWIDFDEYCRTHGLKYPYLVKRLACMVISGVASSDSLNILQPAALTLEMTLKMEEGFALMRDAFKNSLTADEDITFLTKQWYIDVLARIHINAFRVELIGGMYEDLLASAVAFVEAEAAAGNAVYMLPSFYNHDCDPNAHIIWIDNADAKLKALRDVEEGEELRICYIDASMDRDARQELLLHGFGFKCNCSRCLHGD